MENSLFCTQFSPLNAGNRLLGFCNFKVFWGSMPPDTPWNRGLLIQSVTLFKSARYFNFYWNPCPYFRTRNVIFEVCLFWFMAWRTRNNTFEARLFCLMAYLNDREEYYIWSAPNGAKEPRRNDRLPSEAYKLILAHRLRSDLTFKIWKKFAS